jgi:hypothetical protein
LGSSENPAWRSGIMALPVLADQLIVGEAYRLKSYFTNDYVEVIYVEMQEHTGVKTYLFRELATNHEHKLGWEQVQEWVTTR